VRRVEKAAALRIKVAGFEIVGHLGYADVFQFDGVASFALLGLALLASQSPACISETKIGRPPAG